MSQAYLPKSKSDVHITPDRVYEIIEKKWGYKKDEMFDPCPLNPQWDGLNRPWNSINFVNPPYTLLKDFVFKALKETEVNKQSIMLLPAKTDQEWFHQLIEHDIEIIWIPKRLKFKNNKHHATQPHFLVFIK